MDGMTDVGGFGCYPSNIVTLVTGITSVVLTKVATHAASGVEAPAEILSEVERTKSFSEDYTRL